MPNYCIVTEALGKAMRTRYQRPNVDERQDLQSCCKVLVIAFFGWCAIRIALLPFEQGAFTPSNPVLQLHPNGTSSVSSSTLDFDEMKQRVLLIVGHHQALQRNLLDWSESQLVLSNWVYPIPTREDLKAVRFNAPPRYLGFDPLFLALRDNPVHYELDKIDEKAKLAIIEQYRSKAQRSWSLGKSIIIASEYAAYLQDPRVLELWLRTLPVGVKVEEVQVVITYPMPRVDTLMQVWRSCYAAGDAAGGAAVSSNSTKQITRMTLNDFLDTKLHHEFARVNPLGVAVSLVKKGFQTIIIDEKGLERAKADIHSAVGCFLLKMRCNSTKFTDVVEYNREDPPISTTFDLSANKLKRIEKILQDFDCTFLDDLSTLSNVYFLYREALFRSCNPHSREYSSKEALNKIRSIIRNP